MRTDDSESERRRIVRQFGPSEGHIRFDRCIGSKISTLGALEIVVQPGNFAMVLIHSPDPRTGYPLPVGYLSTNAFAVKELGYYLGGLLHDIQPSSVIWGRPGESNKHIVDESVSALEQLANVQGL